MRWNEEGEKLAKQKEGWAKEDKLSQENEKEGCEGIMKEQKLVGAIAQGMTLSSRSNAYLKNAMYKVKPTELIKTIEKETNELFGNLKDKSALEDYLVLITVYVILEKERYINKNVLNSLETFLRQKNINPDQLKDQDLHRIIICVALRVFAEQGSEKAKRLEHLIKRMPLIR